MKKSLVFFYSFIALLFLSVTTLAQTVVIATGHEQAKATVNFTDIANYEAQNPPSLVQQQPENEEDEDQKPIHPIPPTGLLRTRNNNTAQGPLGPLGFGPIPVPNLPPSPPPVDSFEAVLDPGNMIPPDTHGAVDSNYCVTAINPNVRIQSRTGSTVSTVTLNGFWNAVSTSGAFDPRVHYDQFAKRWIMVAVANGQNANSAILIGASQTSNPTGNWYLFSIKADSTSTNWLDYPNVGINKNWIVVTGNYFTVSGNNFTAGKMYIFNKANILAGTSATYTTYSNSNDFTFCPAITYDTTRNNMFVMETWDGSQGTLKLLKISGTPNSPTVSTVGYPTSSAHWLSDGNANNFAPQLGTTNLVSANDDRITQVIFMNNSLWCAHTAFLPYSSTANATRCSVKWWQVDTNGNPLQIGLIDDATGTNFYDFPTIAVNKYNDAIIGFSVLSANIHPSAAYAIRANSDPIDSMRAPHIFRAGQNTYYKTFSGARNRWGDYSGTVLDPLNQADFWTIQEASASSADTWDTWWAHVNTCNLFTSHVTPSGPTTFCVGGAVTLNADTATGYAYQWQNAGNNISGATSSSYPVPSSGTYSLVVTKDNCVLTSPVTTVTYNAAPVVGPITGGSSVCINTSNLSLFDTSTTGTWSSDNTAIATINSSGVVSGVALGTTNIRYTVTNSFNCTDSAIKAVTVGVQTVVAPITGPTSVCLPLTIILHDTSANGTWSSDNTNVATVNSSGVVTSIAAGTANISYSVNVGGCVGVSTLAVTVVAPPTLSPISGASALCQSSTTLLMNSNNGGTWSSSNTSAATISSSGNVSGIAAGTTTISYILTNSSGCADTVTKSVTVNPLPVIGAITGPSTVCALSTISLFDTSTLGTWSSTNTTFATVNSSGVVSGLAVGTTHIRYTETNSFSCTDSAVKTISVTTVPTAGVIGGGTNVCVNATLTLNNSNSNGSWSVTNANATISPVGVVTGIAAGFDTVHYIVSNTCGADTVSTIVVISPAPQPGTITGTDSLCVGDNTTLTHTGTAGTWSSKNSNATINSFGAVAGVAAGADTILYTVTNSCGTVKASFPIFILSTHYCDSVNLVPGLSALAPTIQIYPNPNDGAFTVDISSPLQEPVAIRITNIIGQLVEEYTTATNKKLQIRLNQPNGIYLLTATTAQSRYTTRITISR